MTDLSTSLTASERARVHATAWTILGDTHAADDVAQELAIRLAEEPTTDDPHQRGSWIARQALGLSLNRRRARVRRNWHESIAGSLRADGWVESPEWLAAQAEDADQVRDALASLDEAQRSPLILRYFHGRRLNEIATILGIPLSTAHERIQRGLHALRGRLRRTEVAPALIGLALPRATVLVAPAAVATRASLAVGTIYGLARAAVLAGLLGLTPQAGPTEADSAQDLDLARAELPVTPPHFVRPPGTPEVLIDPLLPEEPPVRPPGESEDERRDDRRRSNGNDSDEDVSGRGLGDGLETGGPLEESESTGAGVLGWTPEVGEVRHALDQGPATRPYVAPLTMDSQRPEDDDDDLNGPESGDSSLGGGAGGGDDDDGGGPGVLLGSSFAGATLEGNLLGWDPRFGVIRPLEDVHVQLLAGQASDGDLSPVAATATSDETGAFSLDLPAGPGAYHVRVGVLDGDEFLSFGTGHWHQDAGGGWTVEFETADPVFAIGG